MVNSVFIREIMHDCTRTEDVWYKRHGIVNTSSSEKL